MRTIYQTLTIYSDNSYNNTQNSNNVSTQLRQTPIVKYFTEKFLGLFGLGSGLGLGARGGRPSL